MLIALDYGDRRTGIAYGENIPRKISTIDTKKVLKVLKEIKPDVVVMGLPLSASGRYSEQTFKTLKFAFEISKYFKVYMIDERFTTKLASRMNAKEKDAMSAYLIFETYVQNPKVSLELRDPTRKISKEVSVPEGAEVLLHEFPDPDFLQREENVSVVTKDPFLAYMYHIRGFFVERYLKDLGKFDIILTGVMLEELKNHLKENGRIVCL
ncbi:MAG: pre-16S rRNA-processing nuclease YqgF [Thermotogaceae bacterium]|nr:pre-16S rRNA-processing nuclease YqgF [Thermotogaceae bacterium]